MDTLILIAIVTGCAFAFMRSANGTSGMNDTEVTLDNIRRGVKNGWYRCVLVRSEGQPAVKLVGKDTTGNDYEDIYPVSEKTWQTLLNEGYKIEEA